MSAIASSFIGYAFKAVVFAAIAYAGIMCGKKFRDYKTNKLKEIASEAVGGSQDK